MNYKKIFSKKNIFFMLLFVALVFIGNNINFSAIVGSTNQQFTFFQFFGPIAGGFLGPIIGAAAVLGAQIIDFVVKGKEATLINLIRLTPMLFAAAYFGFASKKGYGKFFTAMIPLACMGLFILHPVGRQAWFYTLYWLIPVAAVLLAEKMKGKLFLRSLGATFTAHAIGSTAWIWSVPMTAEQWVGLIPVVAVERLSFAIGICVSYVAVNYVLDKAVDKWNLKADVLHIDPHYLLTRKAKKAAA